MADYKLSYTASEIDEKLGKIDRLVSSVNGITPDANGNVTIEVDSSSEVPVESIIDVVELPTENINENAFYRLLTGYYVYGGEIWDNFIVHCVESLPETGLPATNLNITKGNIYYSVSDGMAFGYVDNMLSMGIGVPAGWYDGATLLGALNYTYGGIITDISDVKSNEECCILLNYEYYTYKNEWIKHIFAYEKMPKFDITWDGDMTDRIALDMSALGYANGVYFVKVTDNVPTINEVIGSIIEVTHFNGDSDVIRVYDYNINTTTYPGAFIVGDYITVVHSSDELAAALGIPTGIYTNGVYFWLYTEDGYVSRFTAPHKITKIDSKYLDVNIDLDLNNYVQRIELNNYMLVANMNNYAKKTDLSGYAQKTDLNNYAKKTDLSDYTTKSTVESLIANAISGAIGGSY